MSFLEELIKLLSENKLFANYQAERRIDIFINFFLKEILTTYFKDGSEITFICPEFPIKKSDDHRSTKIDYLYLKEKEGKKEILFIELKTDKRSIREKQIAGYLATVEWKIRFEGLMMIKKIVDKKYKSYRPKYQKVVDAIVAKKISDATRIRLIFISPLIPPTLKKALISKGYKIQEEKKVSGLISKSNPYSQEAKLLSDLFDEPDLDLYVFEISM